VLFAFEDDRFPSIFEWEFDFLGVYALPAKLVESVLEESEATLLDRCSLVNDVEHMKVANAFGMPEENMFFGRAMQKYLESIIEGELPVSVTKMKQICIRNRNVEVYKNILLFHNLIIESHLLYFLIKSLSLSSLLLIHFSICSCFGVTRVRVVLIISSDFSQPFKLLAVPRSYS
jgi:hypothetical protein